jgi:hypothetical protein
MWFVDPDPGARKRRNFLLQHRISTGKELRYTVYRIISLLQIKILKFNKVGF